jgi:hypothetical protein
MNRDLLNHQPFPAKKALLRSAAILLPIALLLGPSSAQTTPSKPTEVRSGSQASVQLELVRIETGFFEAWKTKDQAYFREHMPENGIFWGEDGTFSRDQQLADQQTSAKTCTVEGACRRRVPAHLQSRAVRYLQWRETSSPPERQFHLHLEGRPLAGHLPRRSAAQESELKRKLG